LNRGGGGGDGFSEVFGQYTGGRSEEPTEAALREEWCNDKE